MRVQKSYMRVQAIRPCILRLKLEPQRKLHFARLREQSSVIAELSGELLQRCDTGAGRSSQARFDVKPVQVRNVEHFPSELNALALARECPAFRESHIESGVAVAADQVARSALAGKRMLVIQKSGRGIRKSADVTA